MSSHNKFADSFASIFGGQEPIPIERVNELFKVQRCNRHFGHTFPCPQCAQESQRRQIERDATSGQQTQPGHL